MLGRFCPSRGTFCHVGAPDSPAAAAAAEAAASCCRRVCGRRRPLCSLVAMSVGQRPAYYFCGCSLVGFVVLHLTPNEASILQLVLDL